MKASKNSSMYKWNNPKIKGSEENEPSWGLPSELSLFGELL